MTAPHQTPEWWRGAVIYQAYPRSFQDSNNDGIGDLAGLITRLPYIASLGVDALWLSPILKSPQRDYGYDVSDYRQIDSLFGTMEECDKLIAEAHKLGLKLIFDMVFSHTSIEHGWFRASRAREPGFENWYVWADPKRDGSPPNNWVSLFGGGAWTFDPMRGQYYFHNFLKEQPDLNLHEPAVQDAMLDVAKFWFDKGIDGLRLDVVNFYFHDKLLRDNPPRPPEMGYALQFESPDPYSMQQHVYDKSQPENLGFVERLRALANTYPDRFLMGEIGDDDAIARMAEYTHGKARLHSAYCFALMAGTNVALTPAYIKDALQREQAASKGASWPTWAFSNHDVPRAPSRFRNPGNAAFEKMLLALLMALRGTICLYQGEELGLPEALLAYEQLHDPWGKHLWPVWQGRDGCRTPFPWDDSANAGFSTATPWLPVPTLHQPKNVSKQEQDELSVLHFTRNLLAYRKKNAGLVTGDIAFLDAPENVLAFTRKHENGDFLCVFNLSPEKASCAYKGRQSGTALSHQAGVTAGAVSLDGFGFALIPFSMPSNTAA